MKKLRNEFVFTVNLFTIHPEFENLRRCYYCLGDPRFYQCQKLLPEISRHLVSHSNVLCFFDIRACPAINSEPDLPSERTFFIEIDPEKKCWEGQFHTDIVQKLCWGYTVVIDQCLPIAIFMGFNPIYLIGCDCDYGFSKDKENEFKNSFFYDPHTMSPEYLKSLNESKRLSHQFNQSGIIFDSYRTVQQYCIRNDIYIYNAGYGGKLEIFKRRPFSDLFE
jgi:hypothetical protein